MVLNIETFRSRKSRGDYDWNSRINSHYGNEVRIIPTLANFEIHLYIAIAPYDGIRWCGHEVTIKAQATGKLVKPESISKCIWNIKSYMRYPPPLDARTATKATLLIKFLS